MRVFSHSKKKNPDIRFRNIHRFFGISLLTTTLVTTTVFSSPVYATPSSSEIKEKTGNLQHEIQDLQEQLTSLSSEVENICLQIESLVSNMEQTKLEMQKAQEDGARQYENMKLRIKYIYESGSTSMIEMLCSSKSMTEFLNMSEFAKAINDYDRKMLQELIDTQNKIEEKGHKLEKQQSDLNKMKEQLDKRKADLQARLSSASVDLSYYENLLEEVKKAESLVKPSTPAPSVTPDFEKPKPEATPDKVPDQEPEKVPDKPQPPIDPSGKQKLGSFRITHYCPCYFCCGAWGANTATGTVPLPGRTIAVDPGVIPLGSKVEINGHVYIAEDTGGAIRGNKIDIFVADHQTALNSGVYYADVYLIK